MGTPATHGALFRDRSPIHSLDRMRAPLLVLQGKNDTNVPKAESDLVVERLRARRHPVEYVVYPDEGHGFVRRENRLDAARRTVRFFVRHLGAATSASKSSTAPPAAPPGSPRGPATLQLRTPRPAPEVVPSGTQAPSWQSPLSQSSSLPQAATHSPK
jgi:dienelactone hydrolase